MGRQKKPFSAFDAAEFERLSHRDKLKVLTDFIDALDAAKAANGMRSVQVPGRPSGGKTAESG